MDFNRKISAKIKKIREDKNILQSAVSDRLGLTSNAYGKIENGHTQLTINNLFIICEVLQTSIHSVLDLKESPSFHIKTNLLSPNNGDLHLTLDKDQLKSLKKLIDDNIKKEEE